MVSTTRRRIATLTAILAAAASTVAVVGPASDAQAFPPNICAKSEQLQDYYFERYSHWSGQGPRYQDIAQGYMDLFLEEVHWFNHTCNF